MAAHSTSLLPRSLDSLLERLFRQNQFAIKYDLDAMRHALAVEGLDATPATRILVGGTNGKGTVASTLASMLRAAGLRTALYTSPHLIDFRERMRIDGRCIPEQDAARIGWAILERWGEPTTEPRALSYFELTTLMALRWFAEQDAEVLVLEVGLGGRLDATNALDPDHAVLTSIGLDHQAWLGDTVALIAHEKVHIARPGRPLHMHRHAQGIDILADHPIALASDRRMHDGGGDDALTRNRALAAGVARCVLAERGLADLPCEAAIRTGLANARWPGRQQRMVHAGRTYWIDGAHNEDSMQAAATWLPRELAAAGRTRVPALVGLSPGRDPVSLFAPVVPYLSRVFALDVDEERTQPAAEVAAALRSIGVDAAPMRTVDEVLLATSEEAPLLVIGSLYLVGRFFRSLGLRADDLIVDAGAVRS